MPEELVEIGRVVKPHGIRGEVVVDVLSDLPDRLAPGAEVVVGGTATTVVSSRPHQGRLLVGFAFVPDRTAAERLRGATVQGAAVDIEDDEHFWAHELVGLHVLGPDDEDLGEVVDLVLLPAAAGYDLLEVVRADGHRWLLPAADELVRAEELDDGFVLRVDELPAGLVDPDDADVVPGTASED